MISPIVFLLSLISSSSYGAHVQDFCVADLAVSLGPAGFACKYPADVTVDDFVYSGLRVPANTSSINKAGFQPAFVAQFPGLNGLGVSVGLAYLDVGGVGLIHSHSGTTEVVVITEGSSVIAGFIASNNKVYLKTLDKGDTMVFPQGLYHFFVNQGKIQATIFVSYNSENPGVQRTSLFQNDLAFDIIAKITLLDASQIQNLMRVFGGTN